MHSLLNAMGRSFGHAQELDAESEFVGRAQVGECDRLNTFDRNRPGVDLGPERKRGKNGELVRRIEAADVKAWIRLGIAEPLSLAKADLERQVLALHAGEDVVAGAIENTGNPLDCVSGQALSQGLDDRYPAAYSRFKKELRPGSLGKGSELETMRREHRLIRGNDRRAACKRGLRRVKRDPVGPPINSTKMSMSAEAASSSALAK